MAKFICTHTVPPGKLSSPCFVVPALVAIMVLVAASSLRAGQIDNPEYKAWASFKVGSSRTLTASGGGGGYVKSSGGGTLQSTLKGIAGDKVMVQLGTNANSPSFPVPAKIDERNIKYVGEASIQAMGKTFKCKIYELPKQTSPNGAKSSQTKKWICDDVPGGLVKQEDYHTGPGPSPDLQYKWTETLLLSAYEVK